MLDKLDSMMALTFNIVSEYDQEIPQSQTADKPMALLGRATQPSRDTSKTNLAKQPAHFSQSRWLQKQNGIEQLQTPTMGVTINKSQQQQNHRQPRPRGGGGFNAFYCYQTFALDSAVVEVQEMFSSDGSLLTNTMYSHWETL